MGVVSGGLGHKALGTQNSSGSSGPLLVPTRQILALEAKHARDARVEDLLACRMPLHTAERLEVGVCGNSVGRDRLAEGGPDHTCTKAGEDKTAEEPRFGGPLPD